MLSQLVRPMVQTQIRLLAASRATRSTLVSTIAQWLGFLGVRAQVTRLDASSGKIQISMIVEQPDACDARDWQQILHNLDYAETEGDLVAPSAVDLTLKQQSRMQRLLAYLIQISNPDQPIEWDTLCPKLQALGLDDTTLGGIKSALKIPQCLEDLVDGLDSEVAAIALPKAVSIAMLDRRVNSSEDRALTTLLNVMKR